MTTKEYLNASGVDGDVRMGLEHIRLRSRIAELYSKYSSELWKLANLTFYGKIRYLPGGIKIYEEPRWGDSDLIIECNEKSKIRIIPGHEPGILISDTYCAEVFIKNIDEIIKRAKTAG